MRIVSYPEAEVPAPLRGQVLELQDDAWPPGPADPDPSQGLTHDPALRPLSMLLVDGDVVLAALDVLSKEIGHAGGRWRAAGLSTVVTRRAARGRGHGRRLVAAARDAVAASGADVGLFTCDRPLLAFYESAGWEELPGTVLVGGTPQAPFPSDAPGFDKVTVGAFFSAGAAAWRAAFEHARVALHPGEIDRLW
ncbi:GNAT family N-acetyltransferase [Nonomuraea pusilla]|uniref:Acetyltransferase (GNAT) domain-containing protein n=1 Tax=Nonomuraea pusilla TaxID=46177 RepID=A0A1H8FPG5_9ACTN|nr:GNAT family N-acetyltransferase [Nonomuraea pusilla]SEN33475.1 Acetyltransferase (GNAT) domain-containing protein [Nonomuraea pusilla]